MAGGAIGSFEIQSRRVFMVKCQHGSYIGEEEKRPGRAGATPVRALTRRLVYGLWFMVHGSWCMVDGLWSIVYGS